MIEEVYAIGKFINSTVHKVKEIDISVFSFTVISKQLLGRPGITWGIFETTTRLLSKLSEMLKFWIGCHPNEQKIF